MTLDFGALTEAQFFAEHWRRVPLFIQGGAAALAGVRLNRARFRAIVERLDRDHPAHVERIGDGTIFAQNMDVASTPLADRSAALSEAWSCRRVWWDGVYAVDGSGIGSHYDHSDNFVLQQSGTKIWRLFPPDRIPQDELRRRMLDAPDVGLVDMPDEALEFVLEPGDALYIPLFWAHWGVSVGASLSTSIVFNADSGVDVYLERMRPVLASRAPWWEPVPIGPVGAVGAQAAARPYLERLAATLSQDGLTEALVDAWRRPVTGEGPRPLRGQIYSSHKERPTPFTAPAPIAPPSPEPDIDPETALAWEGIATVDALETVTVSTARDALARVAEEAPRFLTAGPALAAAAALFDAIGRLPAIALADALRAPEVAGWVWRANDAVDCNYGPVVTRVFAGGATLWAPRLLAAGVVDAPLLLAATEPGALRLLGLGRLELPPGSSATLTPAGVTVGRATYPFDAATGSLGGAAPGPVVDLGDDLAVPIIETHAWLSQHWLRGGRDLAVKWGSRAPLGSALTEALVEAARVWPEVARDLARTRWVGPASDTLRAHVGAGSGFFGAVLLSPGDDLAENWIVARAVERLNYLAALDPLADGARAVRVPGPWGDRPRAVQDLLRSLLAESTRAEYRRRRGIGDMSFDVGRWLEPVADLEWTEAGEAAIELAVARADRR